MEVTSEHLADKVIGAIHQCSNTFYSLSQHQYIPLHQLHWNIYFPHLQALFLLLNDRMCHFLHISCLPFHKADLDTAYCQQNRRPDCFILLSIDGNLGLCKEPLNCHPDLCLECLLSPSMYGNQRMQPGPSGLLIGSMSETEPGPSGLQLPPTVTNKASVEATSFCN